MFDRFRAYRRALWQVLLLPCLLSACLANAVSAENNASAIRQAIENFLSQHIKTLPGQASYTIGSVNVAHSPVNCPRWDVSMTPGAKPKGRTHVQLRCDGGTRYWNIFVPVHITVQGQFLVSARAITPGQPITEADLSLRQGDLTSLPNGTLTDPVLAIGKSSGVSLAAGQPIRADMLRSPPVIQQGQTVKLSSSGTGFQVSNEGSALNGASAGQPVRVKLANGHVVGGIARSDGTVEVKF